MLQLAVILCALSAAAAADPKPTIAIVVGAKDGGTVKIADALGLALRPEAAKQYRPVGSAKQVALAMVKAECSQMAPACATAIGTALGAELVLVGEVETRGTHQVLALALVNVRSGQRTRSLRDTTATPADARKWARSVYGRLLGATTGDLVLAANAQRGEILIDGQPAAALFEGRATISGLALGLHAVSIRAKGFRPLDVELAVDGTTKHSLLLEPAP